MNRTRGTNLTAQLNLHSYWPAASLILIVSGIPPRFTPDTILTDILGLAPFLAITFITSKTVEKGEFANRVYPHTLYLLACHIT